MHVHMNFKPAVRHKRTWEKPRRNMRAIGARSMSKYCVSSHTFGVTTWQNSRPAPMAPLRSHGTYTEQAGVRGTYPT